MIINYENENKIFFFLEKIQRYIEMKKDTKDKDYLSACVKQVLEKFIIGDACRYII